MICCSSHRWNTSFSSTTEFWSFGVLTHLSALEGPSRKANVFFVTTRNHQDDHGEWNSGLNGKSGAGVFALPKNWPKTMSMGIIIPNMVAMSKHIWNTNLLIIYEFPSCYWCLIPIFDWTILTKLKCFNLQVACFKKKNVILVDKNQVQTTLPVIQWTSGIHLAFFWNCGFRSQSSNHMALSILYPTKIHKKTCVLTHVFPIKMIIKW